MTPDSGGKLVVLTAPLSEAVDGQNFVLQMSMASMPKWMEFVLNLEYPNWHRLDRRADGSAACMPAGLRVAERALIREFGADEVVACHAGDLGRFIGPRTRVVGVSTHNPLGVTFAAGIFASVFGSSREPITSHDDGPGGPESGAADPSEVADPGTLMPAVDAIRSTA